MCGIVGLSLKDPKGDARGLVVQMLSRLQHRGQDGAGLSVATAEHQLESLRGLGMIAFALRDYSKLEIGPTALAHTRYATTGTGVVGEIQPFVQGSPRIAMAHNGNIVNTAELKRKYALSLETASDLEVLQQLYLRERPRGFVSALQLLLDEVNGAFALMGLEDNGTLWGLRDPFGVRPLYLGRSDDLCVLASESVALQGLENLEIRELSPGEWVRVERSGPVETGVLRSRRNPNRVKKFCMFEPVYFASPVSEFKNSSVYTSRFRLGEALALEILTETKSLSLEHRFDYVVPVPDTARSAAIAVAEKLKVPYREYLVKNPYVSRTFILPGQEQRLSVLREKLSLVGPELKGKRILLVDDSVVRGNTSRQMALRLKEVGAKSVSLASTCPPIVNGCFYGIDFPDPAELIAAGKSREDIAASLGLDEIFYLTQAGLKRALGTDRLCMACLDGDYPTKDSSFDEFLLARQQQRKGAVP
jgi:amidophosphoribosyltransferase